MTFIAACALAIKQSQETNNLIYVYETPHAYPLSYCYVDGWLFRAYPGGRKELSRKGVELAKAEGYDPYPNFQ